VKRIALALTTMAIVAGIVAARAQTSTRADAQPGPLSAKEVRGATPYLEIELLVSPETA
jgi:hypothetical protein